MKTVQKVRLVLGLMIFCAIAGCRSTSPSVSALPTVQMKIGSKLYTLEVANTDETRERGLMRRDSMPADHGMIFVFNTSTRLQFWMKNTRIPLDIVYIDSAAKVDSVKQMQPYVETAVSSEGMAQWAIELNQGQGAESGVKAGDALDIPQPARTAKE